MKNKLFALIFLFIILLFINAGISSCIRNKDVLIDDISFSASKYLDTDSIAYKFHFLIYSTSHQYVSNNYPDLGLIKNCYAWTKCVNFQNQLDTNSYQLYFNEDIYYKGDTIEENTDILKTESIRNSTIFDIYEDCNEFESSIEFNKELSERLILSSDSCKITFYCKTTDGKEFTKTSELYTFVIDE